MSVVLLKAKILPGSCPFFFFRKTTVCTSVGRDVFAIGHEGFPLSYCDFKLARSKSLYRYTMLRTLDVIATGSPSVSPL
jgi:hypothetical protein